MDNLDKLSNDSKSILLVANELCKYYNELSVKNIHIFMAMTYYGSPVKKKLSSYGITFGSIERLFYRKKSTPFKLDTYNMASLDSVITSYGALICIKKAIDLTQAEFKLVAPKDMLMEIIKYDDADVMAILDSKIKDLKEFTDFLESNENDVSNKKLNSIRTKKISSTVKQSAFANLNKYGVDLVNEAKNNKLDIVSGRETEIFRLIEILGRRKKSNPCLVGEAGVGKTAIVEGLAIKIAKGDVPDFLKNSTIFSLEIGNLVAGTKYRGEFEAKIDEIIKEAKDNSNVILFFDEIHNILSSGMSEGGIDAGNILKPYLARGSVKCIGATTLKEYRNSIEKDGALDRRFQKIKVNEPSIKNCIQILEDSKHIYEQHHGVKIPKLVIKYAVELSERYITDRLLPDKAFDLIDEACSKVKIKDNRKKLLRQDIVDVVEGWTGIEVESISSDKDEKSLGLLDKLKSSVIGQDEAITVVYNTILRSKAGFKDATKPIGSFIFSGPTGVGKTELAKNLSKLLFNSEKSLIRIDMSEYSDKISTSKLIGTAPGYVGYKEGGQLSEAVRNNPYSVVLLDEIEKAHPDILNIFLQILDDGHVTDGLGRKVDFKNTILIFTSNLYNPYIKKNQIGFPMGDINASTPDFKESAIKKFSAAFSPEFVNRFDDVIVFNKLSKNNMFQILDLLITEINLKARKKGITLIIDKKTKNFLIEKCNSSLMGARPLKRILTKYIENPLSFKILNEDIQKNSVVKISCNNNEILFDIEQKDVKKTKSLETAF